MVSRSSRLQPHGLYRRRSDGKCEDKESDRQTDAALKVGADWGRLGRTALLQLGVYSPAIVGWYAMLQKHLPGVAWGSTVKYSVLMGFVAKWTLSMAAFLAAQPLYRELEEWRDPDAHLRQKVVPPCRHVTVASLANPSIPWKTNSPSL